MIIRREVFVASDGRTFDTYAEARNHESVDRLVRALQFCHADGLSPAATAQHLLSRFNISPRLEP